MSLILQKIIFRAVILKVMKTKRAKKKARISPLQAGIKPPPEKCWYCGLNADAGAQAAIVLTKPDDDFQYFISDPEEEKKIATQVEIPRCAECQIAHHKVDDPRWISLLFCLAGVALLGVYFGIFIKTFSWWVYLVIGLVVSAAITGIAIGANRNLLTLPGNIKPLSNAENHPEVHKLELKGWKIKR